MCSQTVVHLHVQQHKHSFGVMFLLTPIFTLLLFMLCYVVLREITVTSLQHAPLCAPASHFLCPSAVLCWGSCVQRVYQNFITEKSFPLQLHRWVVDQNTKTIKKRLKSSMELKRALEMDENSLWVLHRKLSFSYDTYLFDLCLRKNID